MITLILAIISTLALILSVAFGAQCADASFRAILIFGCIGSYVLDIVLAVLSIVLWKAYLKGRKK